jgi:hypothetical protein
MKKPQKQKRRKSGALERIRQKPLKKVVMMINGKNKIKLYGTGPRQCESVCTQFSRGNTQGNLLAP